MPIFIERNIVTETDPEQTDEEFKVLVSGILNAMQVMYVK